MTARPRGAGSQYRGPDAGFLYRAVPEAIGGLPAEYDGLQSRLDAKYVDKLDGRIDEAFYDRMVREWRAE